MRIALGISYNGQAYQGWQSQPSGQTVQDQLEAALAKFSAQPVTTLCAGRTDAGVHALNQVVHFDTPLARNATSWIRGVNSFLPRDIAVEWAQDVPSEFHCRASAQSRRYVYVLLESPVRPSVFIGRIGWTFRPLDGDAMQQAAAHLLGQHDFSSFRASACQALTPVKTLQRIDISKSEACWRFEFEADAFLHHMIRNIMGCLIAVGQGRKTHCWVKDVRDARSRAIAAPTYPPDGLYFLGPRYASKWGLPERTPLFDGLP